MSVTEKIDRWEELAAACGQPLRRLSVAGRAAFLLEPAVPAVGRPWAFYAPAFEGVYPTGRQAWIFSRVTAAGVAVAGIDVGESFGSPAGRALFAAFHAHAVQTLGLARRPCLVPQSRGGLMLYTWAVEYPDRVAGVVGIYTVGDLRSYPGLEKAAPAYGMSAADLATRLADHNPVDRLAPLARHGVPIWHLHGDADTYVPMEANGGALVQRYRELGGSAELIVVPGRGHEEHADYFERQDVVDAIVRFAVAG